MTNRFTPRTLLVPYVNDADGVDVGFGGGVLDERLEAGDKDVWLAMVLTPTPVLVGVGRTTWSSGG